MTRKPVAPDESASNALIKRMRADWNSRAVEDAEYYIACSRRKESRDTFRDHAVEVVSRIRRDFHWFSPTKRGAERRFIEIGCGVGRLMEHLAGDCGEIHGVDISDEMVARGRMLLADIRYAHLHVADKSDLRAFADASFDLVYSYAVLQHLPANELFWRYLSEALRVLVPGGLLIIQFNGSEDQRVTFDTWAGVSVPAEDVVVACQISGLRIRSVEGENTQYVWITAQKPEYTFDLVDGLLRIDEVIGADDKRAVLVSGGPKGYASLFVKDLPITVCDVTELSIEMCGHVQHASYVGRCDHKGRRQINFLIQEGLPLGTASLVLRWRAHAISKPYPVQLVPPPLAEPRLLRLTDGIELGRQNEVACGWAKIWIEDLIDPDQLNITIGGVPAVEVVSLCEDKRQRRYQINVRIPNSIPTGKVLLIAKVKGTELPPVNFVLLADGNS